MHDRICPKCGFHLNSYNYYFCSNCGQKLEDAFVRPFSVARVSKFQPPKNEFGRPFKKAYAYLKNFLAQPHVKRNLFLGFTGFFVTASVISAIAIYMYPLWMATRNTTPLDSAPTNVMNLKIAVLPGRFGTQTLASYVPQDAALYLESTSYDYFVEKYFAPISPYKNELRVSKNLVNENFAVFVIKMDELWEVGAVFTPAVSEHLAEDLEKLKNDKVVFDVVDGEIIVGTNQKVIDRVKEIRNKISPSLMQNPYFVTSNSKLQKEGVIKAIILNGDVKALSKKAASFVPEIGPLLERIVNSGYNEVVIL